MANVIRLKRSTGSSAPSSLANAEPAYCEGNGILYIGVGTGGAGGSATTIQAVAGPGYVVTLAGGTTQTISRNTTFSGTVILGSSATATTPATNDDSTAVATTAWVKAQNYGSGGGSGSVTSVALALPNIFTVSGSPVTTSGTLTGTLATQNANKVLAGPTTGADATPAFRTLVAGDIPDISATYLTTSSASSTYLALTGGTISSNLTISGNLTVNGTTTTINSTAVSVDDINIILGDTASPSDATADGGGITLKGTTDKTLNWVDSTDAWTSSEHFDLASGKAYYIGGTSVLSGSTLGSGVTASSLTSVGTLTSGSLGTGFTTVAVSQGGTGATTLTGILKGNGTSAFTAATAGTDYLSPSSDIDGGTYP
jgi:hypothetical protein